MIVASKQLDLVVLNFAFAFWKAAEDDIGSSTGSLFPRVELRIGLIRATSLMRGGGQRGELFFTGYETLAPSVPSSQSSLRLFGD